MDTNATPAMPKSDIDPSALTTQQLWREIAALKELLLTRITSVERGIVVAHDDLVRVPTDTQKQVSNLKEILGDKISNSQDKIEGFTRLAEEKFSKMEQRFEMIEKARVEQKNDAKQAVVDAMSAAEKKGELQTFMFTTSINKSEVATTKQIDQLASIGEAGRQGLDSRINDVKDRLTKLEGISQGAGSPGEMIARLAALESAQNTSVGKSTGMHSSWVILIGAVGLLATLLSIVAYVATHFMAPAVEVVK